MLVQPEKTENSWRQEHPELGQIWRWHGIATSLGRAEGYLSRITEVAREVAKGNPLSEKARGAMQRDFELSANLINKQDVSTTTPRESNYLEMDR